MDSADRALVSLVGAGLASVVVLFMTLALYKIRTEDQITERLRLARGCPEVVSTK